jgi:hypothetical protein
MAYPPDFSAVPDRVNTTVSATNHPADHDRDRDAIIDIVNTLGIDPTAGWASVQARLADLLQIQEAGGGSIVANQDVKGPVTFEKPVRIEDPLTVTDAAVFLSTINVAGILQGTSTVFQVQGSVTGHKMVIADVATGNQPANSVGFYSDGNLVGAFHTSGQFFLYDTDGVPVMQMQAQTDGDLLMTVEKDISFVSTSGSVSVTTGGVSTSLGTPPWVNCAYASGWGTHSGRQRLQARLIGDRVEIRGEISGGPIDAAGGSPIGTLPSSDYRPSSSISLNVSEGGTNTSVIETGTPRFFYDSASSAIVAFSLDDSPTASRPIIGFYHIYSNRA